MGQPLSTAPSESARYRTGIPGPGEVTVRGPRVLGADGQPGAEVVAAVDEAIHYTARKAGYHGGASPAEVVIPVITLLPSASLLPQGWYAYDAGGHAPPWWNSPAARSPMTTAEPGAGSLPRPSAGRGKKKSALVLTDEDALFGVAEVVPGLIPPDSADSPVQAFPAASATPAAAPAPATFGARVAASDRMASQRQFVRRAPADASITALIGALVCAGGRLTVTEVATATGEPPVRMSGYLAQAIRLLNVDSYPVLQLKDAGKMVELNESLLRQQFLGN
jgi:hypothetical protein